MMKTIKQVLAVFLFAFAGSAAAQGIPTIDVASITMNATNQAQNIAKYIEMVDQYKNQLDQMKRQYEALNGSRNLGLVMNDPKYRSYLPDDWQRVYDGIQRGGYNGLTGSAKAIRDANRILDVCAGKTGEAKTLCERTSSKAAQDKAFSAEAFDKAQGRWDQIQQLMGQINATTDPKAIAELQARINAESAAIQNEQTKLLMYQMMAQAEEKLQMQAERERSVKQARTIQYSEVKPIGGN